MPKFSIVIPIHDMPNGDFFLWRAVNSVLSQTFKDYEIIITKDGLMAENTNSGMRKAKGELIKILYMDDYLAHPNALKNIADTFTKDDTWMATGCLHQQADRQTSEQPHSPHYPEYTEDIHRGHNCIGSPSVVVLRNEGKLYFDEKLSWLLDCDLYRRYYETYGRPKILNDLNVIIGLGVHQTTHQLSSERKLSEHSYLEEKYE